MTMNKNKERNKNMLIQTHTKRNKELHVCKLTVYSLCLRHIWSLQLKIMPTLHCKPFIRLWCFGAY